MEKADKQLVAEVCESETGVMSVYLRVRGRVIRCKITDVTAATYRPPVLFIKGTLSITTRREKTLSVRVPWRDAETLYAQKLKLDEAAGINAFKAGRFRAPYYYMATVIDYLPMLVVAPIGFMLVIGGVLLFRIGMLGIVFGLFLMAIGMGISALVIRLSINGIEGHCPICDKLLRANVSAPFLYCTKCKEKVSIENGYFEVE